MNKLLLEILLNEYAVSEENIINYLDKTQKENITRIDLKKIIMITQFIYKWTNGYYMNVKKLDVQTMNIIDDIKKITQSYNDEQKQIYRFVDIDAFTKFEKKLFIDYKPNQTINFKVSKKDISSWTTNRHIRQYRFIGFGANIRVIFTKTIKKNDIDYLFSMKDLKIFLLLAMRHIEEKNMISLSNVRNKIYDALYDISRFKEQKEIIISTPNGYTDCKIENIERIKKYLNIKN